VFTVLILSKEDLQECKLSKQKSRSHAAALAIVKFIFYGRNAGVSNPDSGMGTPRSARILA
jgi:hypothetical protein